MTSIKNYESVELPFEDERKKKNILETIKNSVPKKFDFRIKKKHIAVASMVLMLSGAVYVNYLYASGDIENFVETGKNYGESILVEGNADEKISYLSGIGKHGDNLISLLNIAGVIVEKEAQ